MTRSFRKQKSEQKLHAHTKDSIQRRDPSISTLTTKYNSLCDEMAALIAKGKASTNAQVPRKINKESLFDLDVDKDIWQTFGLSDDDGEIPPPWMADESVRKGIRAMLELDRCREENARLKIQRQALQEWFVEEWQVLTIALGRVKGGVVVLINDLHESRSGNTGTRRQVTCGPKRLTCDLSMT
ncbi:hypothetical protein K435DRAFT_198668, partial [Dendrothele bispora CBS 962.96]